jgi:Helicase HerA, central domain
MTQLRLRGHAMFSEHSLDDLQRTGYMPPPIDLSRLTQAGPAHLRAVRVRGIGKADKSAPDGMQLTAGASRNRGRKPVGQQGIQRPPADRARLPSEDLLVGLSTYEIPVAFQLRNEGTQTSVEIGTWLTQDAEPTVVEENLMIAAATLRAVHLSIDLEPMIPGPLRWPCGGIALGLPSVRPSETGNTELPVDRLIRAMRGMPWACTIVAQPLAETEIRTIRNEIVSEIRAVQSAMTTRGPSPMEQYYIELLQQRADSLQDAQATGAWRTGAYLSGTGQSFYALTAIWRAIFSGADSQVEPLRTYELDHAVECAHRWALPDPVRVHGAATAGFRHRFTHQTLLNSSQLAAYIHLPAQETSGFRVDTVPMFDTSPQEAPVGEPIRLGRVIEARDYRQSAGNQQASGDEFIIGHDLLTRHAFITGLTGEGKTTTVQRLLVEAWRRQVPFLVIEPAKHEYRQLLADREVGPNLRVFTPGLEAGVPLRMNPFEVPGVIPVSVHLDLLRSAFNASFGMWTPLPQVLEICLQEVYEDRGWDLTSGTNFRLRDGDDLVASFPRMSDLVAKVEPVVASLGYDTRVADDIRAALTTRLHGLASGPKGRMFDVQYSVPMEFILAEPTIIELENIGDDDDKAFVMSVLLIRLVEHWRTLEQPSHRLRHLLVIEEAHRLLANVVRQRDETQSDARGKAVETFADFLAEIRAYGEGVVIVDQSATKLTPDVIRNSNLKIAHRVVDGADRETISKSTVMNDRQERALATLARGSAAVFLTGEDAPLHVLITPLTATPGSPDAVHLDLVKSMSLDRIPPGVLRPQPGACELDCNVALSACAAAVRSLGDAGVRSAIARSYATAELIDPVHPEPWAIAERRARHFRSPDVAEDEFRRSFAIHAAHWISRHRGDQRGWTYVEVDTDEDNVRQIFLAHAQDHPPTSQLPLARRPDRPALRHGPFTYCSDIWAHADAAPCGCHQAITDQLTDGDHAATWTANASIAERSQLCQTIASEAVLDTAQIETAKSFYLCAAQQLLHRTGTAGLEAAEILDHLTDLVSEPTTDPPGGASPADELSGHAAPQPPQGEEWSDILTTTAKETLNG